MKKKYLPLLTLIAGVLPLVGCSGGEQIVTTTEMTHSYFDSTEEGTATIRIFKDNDSTSRQRYISPKDVDLKFSYNDLSGLLANNENVCPSIGDVNLLVIPVHLPGSTYNTEEVKNDIETVFFGSGEDNGFLSLKDFYYQSSFGKLNFNGFVTDWFDVESQTNISSLSEITSGNNGTIITEIFRKSVDWAFDTYDISRKDYDVNNDGSIDGVFLVYDHYDYFTQFYLDYADGITSSDEDLNSAFWNFSAWDWGTSPDLDNPTTSGFSWASFNSMYLGYMTRSSIDGIEIPDFDTYHNVKLDSHVYIHETGHLLGLEDYYTSHGANPMGCSTMMDQNIGDLDQYSKMLLGWVTPYVVYGTSEILIKDKDENDHSLIVVPSNYAEISSEIETAINHGTIDEFRYTFNPFSEYLLIDLYAPTGIDRLDLDNPIYGREETMNRTGVRIYHVDSRIFKCTVVNYDGGQALYYASNPFWDGEALNSNEAILMPISNERVESSTYQLPASYDGFEQIRLLESSGLNTFDNGSYATSAETLWVPASSPFEIATFGYQFFNGHYTFNDGNNIPFKIRARTLREAVNE